MRDTNPYILDWSIRQSGDGSLRIQGNVYGHKSFRDGSFITTSALKSVVGGVAKTENSAYTLISYS